MGSWQVSFLLTSTYDPCKPTTSLTPSTNQLCDVSQLIKSRDKIFLAFFLWECAWKVFFFFHNDELKCQGAICIFSIFFIVHLHVNYAGSFEIILWVRLFCPKLLDFLCICILLGILWTFYVVKLSCQLLGEPGTGGSSTPSMVGSVKQWQKSDPQKSQETWKRIASANSMLEEQLKNLSKLAADYWDAYSHIISSCSRHAHGMVFSNFLHRAFTC